MNKLISFFKSISGIITSILGLLVLILFYVLGKKNRELSVFKTKAALAKTKEEVDNITRDLKALKDKKQISETERKEIDSLLLELKEKQKTLISEHENKNSTEIEDYWNNKDK